MFVIIKSLKLKPKFSYCFRLSPLGCCLDPVARPGPAVQEARSGLGQALEQPIQSSLLLQ